MDVNQTFLRNIYPSATGQTVAVGGTGAQTNMVNNATPGQRVPGVDSPDPVQRAVTIGNQANPVVAGLVLLGLLVGLMFLAKRLGADDDFRSIRPTVYNVIVISMAAVIGLPFWKYLATKFPVPGVSGWILAS
jgi:hypothetical protein